MKFQMIFLVFLILPYVGCKEQSSAQVKLTNNIQQYNEIEETFEAFFDRIPSLDSGYSANCNQGLRHVPMESKFIPEGAQVLGKLGISAKLYHIIYTYPADIRIPVWEAYDGKGKKWGQANLFDMGFCSSENPSQFSKFTVVGYCKVLLENLQVSGSDTVVLNQDRISEFDFHYKYQIVE